MTAQTKEEKADRPARDQKRLSELERTRLAIQSAIDALLEETGGEVTDEVDELADSLLLMDELIAQKLDRYAYVIKSLEADRNRLMERASVLDQRATALDKTVQRLKTRLQEYIEANVEPDAKGRRKVEGELHTLWIQAAGGKLPLEIDEDVNPITTPFSVTKYGWDRDAIRSALEAGDHMPYARLGERGKTLRIK